MGHEPRAEAPPTFLPGIVELSYNAAEIDALIDFHFSDCDVVGFGAFFLRRVGARCSSASYRWR
jgi:hypothetical protein